MKVPTQSIEGVAVDAKRSCAVLTDEEIPYFLDGVSNWEPELIGKRVVVTGEVVEVTYQPDSSGLQKQEIKSSYKLIKSPKYRLASGNEVK
ncbi:MAG: hypothetical protein NXI09_15865 [Bacteroidetes bacterium]|nr:hypothetical protein [Bacteroidota bacterium]